MKGNRAELPQGCHNPAGPGQQGKSTVVPVAQGSLRPACRANADGVSGLADVASTDCDKQVVEEPQPPANSRVAEGSWGSTHLGCAARVGGDAELLLKEPSPTECDIFFADEGIYTEEELALLRSLSNHSEEEDPHVYKEGKVRMGPDSHVCPQTFAEARASHGARVSGSGTPLGESMDEHDYAMLTETLREVGNPLLRTKHDPSLATADAVGLGCRSDLTERIDRLLGHDTTTGQEADWAERRVRHRRSDSPSRKRQSAETLRGVTAVVDTSSSSAAVRPSPMRRRRGGNESAALPQAEVAAPAEGLGQRRLLRESSHGAEKEVSMTLLEPSPRDLTETAATPSEHEVNVSGRPGILAPQQQRSDDRRDEEAIVITSSSSQSQSAAVVDDNGGGDGGHGRAETPSEANHEDAKQNATVHRLKLRLGTQQEQEPETTTHGQPNEGVGRRLRLKAATTKTSAATGEQQRAEETGHGGSAATVGESPPPRKVLRLGVAERGLRTRQEEERQGQASEEVRRTETKTIESLSSLVAPTTAAKTASSPLSARQAVSPNAPGSPSVSIFSPRVQRPPPIADPNGTPQNAPLLATAATAAGASALSGSSSYSPTTAVPHHRRHEAPASSGSASKLPTGSPLSPRRTTTGDEGSAFAAFVGHTTPAGGAHLKPRSLTPTPTPTALYNLSDATPHRTHGATKVPLPLAPSKVDFGTVAQWVEDIYEATEKISEGTYGEVYRGRVKLSGEPVALKRLKTLRGLDGFPITSLREVIALQHINRQRKRLLAVAQSKRAAEEETAPCQRHHSPLPDPLEEIVELRDVLLSKESSHDIYLVFNYANSSMAGLLTRRFPFTLPDIAYIFRKIVQGVSKLHDMGIIHRDIKTDNVLISQDGSVQLADFGLCVFEGSGARALTPSMINLSYRPPEMLLGSTQYDKKVDIWSVGCFLAQIFLHQPPFYRRRNSEEQARAARHNRSAETELEQLAAIAEVLGPVTDIPADAFPASTCAHLEDLKRLQEAVLMSRSAGRPSASASSPTATTGAPAKPNLSKLEALFSPSFAYGQFRGFRRWFASQMDMKRTQYILSSGGGSSGGGPPPAPLLLPSPACIDVLEAIFQYDPRRRPTAAELLQRPFFSLFEHDASAGIGGSGFQGATAFFGSGLTARSQGGSADPEALHAREQIARGRLSEKLRKVRDSHIQPQPKQP